jgi:cytochrome c peroxidase
MKRSFSALTFVGLLSLSSQAETIELGKTSEPGQVNIHAGIAKGDKLSIDEIRAFLSNEANHKPLDVALPVGLDAAKQSVYIPTDNPLTKAKIELGRQLYFDRRLSSDGTVSCADCHHPDYGYAKDTQFGVGVRDQTGNRNSPTSYNRILSKAQFWDGRADSLEAQAVGPIANPIEMGNTHEKAVKTIAAIPGYVMQFEKVFGRAVNIDDVGRAIAAFERTIVTGAAPYDYYEALRRFEEQFADDIEDLAALKEDDKELYDQYMALKKASDDHPMSESAKRGRELFFTARANCAACHVGPNFTDELYHNLGVGMEKAEPDLGRYAQTKVEKDKGAFKTPTLRNVALTGPYMHDGSQKTLEEVIDWYAKGGHANPHLSDKVKPIDLKPEEKADLVEFMKALTGPLPTVEEGKLP